MPLQYPYEVQRSADRRLFNPQANIAPGLLSGSDMCRNCTLKVLVLSQFFWPEQFRLNDAVQGLKERGHQVAVLTGQPNYPAGELYPGYRNTVTHEDFHGVPVWRVPVIPRRSGRALQLILNYFSFVFSASLLGPFLTRRLFPGGPDVILVWETSPVTVGIPGAVLRAAHRVPLAFWVQDLWPENLSATGAVQNQRALNLVSAMVRWIYRHCDTLLVQSRAFTSSLMQHGVPPTRIQYLPNSAEGLYRPLEPLEAEPEAALVAPDSRFTVLFAGNLGSAQNLEGILQAATHLRHEPVRWLFLGDGRERARLEEEIGRQGLQDQVAYLGAFPTERMPYFFARADALLVSLRADSAFDATIPAKLQSYLASGKPVLAALGGEGARIVTEAGAGFASDPQHPESLAHAVKSLMRLSPQERAAMGARGREYHLENFEREKLLTRLEELLELTARGGIH